MNNSFKALRPWIPAIVWIIVIYSTLGVVRPICEYLRGRIPLSLVINSALSIGLAATTVSFFRRLENWKPKNFILLIIVLVAYTIMMMRLSIPEERIHLAEYGILGYLILRPLSRSLAGGPLYFLAWVLASLVGWGDEMIQYCLPNRYFQWSDVGLNVVSAGLGLSLTWSFFEQGKPLERNKGQSKNLGAA